MTGGLTIPLGGLGAEDEEPITITLKPNPIDETMSLALEQKEPLRIQCQSEKHAQALRFRFYHRRTQLRKMGVASFDSLYITMEGSILTLSRFPEFKIL